MMIAHLILYVADQNASSQCYQAVLGCLPDLDVPGMTEFRLGPGTVLGLMPVAGIQRLLGSVLPDPTTAAGIPRAEVYLEVKNAADYHARSLMHGGRELSPMALRDWGHRVAYSLDLDGHVLAFAESD